jgi:uncharacterized membrane protein YoaK (UPF0700 family)
VEKESWLEIARTRRCILGAIGGYVDGVSFLMLSGFFVNQVTGDVIVGAVALVRRGSARSWVELAMLPIFYLAIIAATVAVEPFGVRSGGDRAGGLHAAKTLFAVQTGLLVLFGALGLAFHPTAGVGSAVVTGIVGGVGVCAMACQAALVRLERDPESTTVMTTNTVQLGIDTAHLLVGGGRLPDRQDVRERVTELAAVLLSFFVGAAVGAALADLIHFWSVLIPAAAVGVLAFRAHRELKR